MNIPDSSPPAEPPSAVEPSSAESPPDGTTGIAFSKPAWSPTGIAWICVLFSMLPAGIMYALNFERMGQPARKKRALILVLAAALVYYVLILRFLWLPDFDPLTEISARAWMQISSIVIAWCYYLGQQKHFVRYIKAGGKKAPLFMPILLSATLMMAMIIPVGFYLFQRDMNQFETARGLLEKGRHREAEILFKKYKRKYPGEPETNWNLALVYARTERFSLAEQELKELLQRQPDNEEAREWLKNLQARR